MAYIIYKRGDFIIATFFLKDVSPEKKVYTLNPRVNFFAVKQKALADNPRAKFPNSFF